jgi:hypothetical protein
MPRFTELRAHVYEQIQLAKRAEPDQQSAAPADSSVTPDGSATAAD